MREMYIRVDGSKARLIVVRCVWDYQLTFKCYVRLPPTFHLNIFCWHVLWRTKVYAEHCFRLISTGISARNKTITIIESITKNMCLTKRRILVSSVFFCVVHFADLCMCVLVFFRTFYEEEIHFFLAFLSQNYNWWAQATETIHHVIHSCQLLKTVASFTANVNLNFESKTNLYIAKVDNPKLFLFFGWCVFDVT